ncbi:MAG: glycosyltransferase family 9 protein [Thermoanaerobaculia bacterium]
MSPSPVPPFTPDGVLAEPLAAGTEPRRLVVIRLHAFGDTAITFPLLAALKRRRPSLRLDVVTDVRSKELFEAHRDVDTVFAFETRQRRLPKGLAVLRTAAALRRRAVPAVLDLQRNRWSLFLTRLLVPRARAAFDRHAPLTALRRYLDAAEALGLGRLEPVLAPHAREELLGAARARLAGTGWNGGPLVCLNPAGGWETKEWPLGRWVELGERLEGRGCQLMALAAAPVPPRFAALREALGARLLDFAGATTPGEALALVALASLVVSEDSGLMHLAWVQGVPTLALFGSTRSAWSRPEGPHADGLYSEDLSCGACMQPACARGDLLCLTRVPVHEVEARALSLMHAGAATRSSA